MLGGLLKSWSLLINVCGKTYQSLFINKLKDRNLSFDVVLFKDLTIKAFFAVCYINKIECTDFCTIGYLTAVYKLTCMAKKQPEPSAFILPTNGIHKALF